MGDPHTHYSGLFRTVSQTTTATTKTTSSTSSSQTIRPFASTTGFHDPSSLNHFQGVGQYGQLPQNHPYHAGMGFAPIPPARSSSLNLSSARFMPYQSQMAESSAMGSTSHGQGLMGPPQYTNQQQQQQQMWNGQMGGYPYMAHGVYQMSPQDQALASTSSISLVSQDETGDEDEEEEEEVRPVKSKPKPRKRVNQAEAEGEEGMLAEERKMRTREKGRERQRRKRERDRMARDGVKPDVHSDMADVTGTSTQSSVIEPHSFDSLTFDIPLAHPSFASSSQVMVPKTSNTDFPTYSPGLSYSSASVSEHSSPSASFSRSLPLDGLLTKDMAQNVANVNHAQLKWIPETMQSQNQSQNQSQSIATSETPLGPSSTDRASKRTKRRQSEPQSADMRLSISKSNAPRPMTASTSSARPTSRRGISEGTDAALASTQAVIDPNTTSHLAQQSYPAHLSQESSFFASTMIFGVTNSNLIKSLEQNLGIGRNELEGMRGALANMFEQYQIQRGLRNVSIQDASTGTGSQRGAETGGDTPYSTSSSVFSTPGSEMRMNLPNLVINGPNMVEDGPLSADSSTSSIGQPFSLDLGLSSQGMVSPTRSLSVSSQSSSMWDPFVQTIPAQPNPRGSISQSASPVRPVRAPGRHAISPSLSHAPADLGLDLSLDVQSSGTALPTGPISGWSQSGLASPFAPSMEMGDSSLHGGDHGVGPASEANQNGHRPVGGVPWPLQPMDSRQQGSYQT